MNVETKGLLLAAVAFLLGSIPFGFIAGKLKGKDLRELGSKNIGATNTMRELGLGPGIAVLVLDALKGLLPVVTAKLLTFPSIWFVAIGVAAMLGHIFSPFLGFKGGKGVATGLGVIIGLSPLIAGISVAIFLLTVWLTRYISLGSILGAVSMGVLFLALPPTFFTGESLPYKVFGVIAATFIVYRHKENIKRLRNGTENRFSFKKRDQGI